MATTRRKGLGKGLDSLIPKVDVIPAAAAPTKSEATADMMVKISKIEPNKDQPRKNFDENALAELAESIKQYGVIQPLIVQKRDDHYEIIAGERRWRAAQIAGVKEVPVIVKNYSEQEIMEIALIENIQRENLNPIEEALAYKKLLDEFKLKQEDVAKRVSKNRTTITNSMRLLKLSEKVQAMVIDGTLSTGHARALLPIEDEQKQLEVATKIVKGALSVRETEKLVKKLTTPENAPKEEKKPEKKNDIFYREMEEKFKVKLGTNVKVNNKRGNKGKIEIEYYSADELERIYELLMAAEPIR